MCLLNLSNLGHVETGLKAKLEPKPNFIQQLNEEIDGEVFRGGEGENEGEYGKVIRPPPLLKSSAPLTPHDPLFSCSSPVPPSFLRTINNKGKHKKTTN